MTSPALRLAGIGHGIAFRPRSTSPLVDSGFDTNEELDDSETGVDLDADASAVIAVGSVIKVESELMLVSATGATLTVERGYGNSTAATHVTNTDVFLFTTTNTVLWLPGQDDPQSSTIRDRSGNGFNGTIDSALWEQNSRGLWGLHSDGLDDKITLPDMRTSFTDEATLMMWIKTDVNIPVATAQSGIYSMGTSGQESHYPLGAGSDLCFLDTFRDDRIGNIDASSFDKSIWHLHTVTNKPGANNWILYINGTSFHTAAGEAAIALPAAPLIFESVTGVSTMDGQQTLFRLWNRALSATQIAGIYRQERGLFGV